MSSLNTNPSAKPRLNRSGVGRFIQLPVFILFMGAILFGIAGRLDWWEAWAFVAGFIVFIVAAAVWALRHDPDILNECGRIAENTKSWDKILLTIYSFLLLGMLAVAGLDARFRWSAVPLAVEFVGWISLLLAMGLVAWAAINNAYLSAVVRIQDDRGHQVVTTGPYRYVRHPMYAADLFFFWGIPLLLGSWRALVPSLLIVVVMIIRIALEDKTLQAELPGYKEYAKKVRYRLFSGIW
jgi:protein-S-isoprenylcysteine O-methyltransferase Ste14